ncbi:unnamed protein product [Brugia timori]|uniref:Thiolase_N domain-containing protein n=1 Tax=Brugia timori TaxID=42155 RepID=A0A0R3QB52_9BILA|nr:unnamed protein product [Brugia timori]
MSRSLLINLGNINRIKPLYTISCCYLTSTAPTISRKIFSKPNQPNIVLVDAVRTPFLQSRTMFKNMMAMDLQRAALLALMDRAKVNIHDVGHIVCGTVIQEYKTSNVAREAALMAGFSKNIPAHTVTLACISSNVAITDVMNMLSAGYCNAGIAGGVELLSDVPIRYNRKVRSAFLSLDKAKKFSDKLTAIRKIALNFFSPELPAVAEFTTGETMGHSGDRLAAAFGVSRRAVIFFSILDFSEQDEFAIRSHMLADRASKENLLSDIVPVFVPGSKPMVVRRDNGIRVSSMEKLSQLKPAFVKSHGTVTAGKFC